MAAKRLAAMFDNKEQEAKDYNSKNTVKNSSASRPVIHKEKQQQNGSSNSPYFQRMLQQQQKKQDQQIKFQPQHKPDSNTSNTSNIPNHPNPSNTSSSSSSSSSNNSSTKLNDISFNNGNSIHSKILMFSNPNHGLPTAQNITKRDSTPKTSYQSGSTYCIYIYYIFI